MSFMIDGPFTIGIVDNETDMNRELHINFTDDFCSLDLSARNDVFSKYVTSLHDQILGLPEDSLDRQGMLVILQFVEMLTPHLAADEVPLSQTIVVALMPDNPLAELLEVKNTGGA